MKQRRMMAPAQTAGGADGGQQTTGGAGPPLMASNLKSAVLSNVPQSQIWGTKVSQWTQMLSPQLQTCAVAAAGHLIQTWTSELGSEVLLSDNVILAAYSQLSGYDPQTGAGDNGVYLPALINYWASTGIGGHVIDQYLALESGNQAHIQVAVFAFGGCIVELELPASAKSQDVWSVPAQGAIGIGARRSWCAHVVSIIGYDQLYLTSVTCGQIKRMTWNFLMTYWGSAYAVFSQSDFVTRAGTAPNGLNLSQLQDDWGLL